MGVAFLSDELFAKTPIPKAYMTLALPVVNILLDPVLIFGLNLGAAVTNFTQTLGVALTNRSLLPYGNDSLAVMGIVMKIIMIVALVVVGLAFGGQPLIGYTYGAKDKERMQQVIAFALKVVVGTSAVLAASRHRIHGHRSGFNLYLSGYREKPAVAFSFPLSVGDCLCRRPVSGLPVGITHSLFRLPRQVFSS